MATEKPETLMDRKRGARQRMVSADLVMEERLRGRKRTGDARAPTTPYTRRKTTR